MGHELTQSAPQNLLDKLNPKNFEGQPGATDEQIGFLLGVASIMSQKFPDDESLQNNVSLPFRTPSGEKVTMSYDVLGENNGDGLKGLPSAGFKIESPDGTESYSIRVLQRDADPVYIDLIAKQGAAPTKRLIGGRARDRQEIKYSNWNQIGRLTEGMATELASSIGHPDTLRPLSSPKKVGSLTKLFLAASEKR